MHRWVVACLLTVGISGCHRHPPAGGVVDFALGFVAAARAGTPGAPWVDDELVQRIRRAQKLHLAARAGAPPEMLARAWAEDPEAAGASDGRSDKQRERAAQAVQKSLHGDCRAERDGDGAQKRVAALTAPVERLEVARPALERLAAELGKAELARVQCASGALGLLAVPHDGSWRVVDIFPLSDNRSPLGAGAPPVPTR